MMTTDSERRVIAEVIAGEAEMLDDLRDLVRTPSVVGHEAVCQTVMETKLRAVGLSTSRFQPVLEDLSRHHAYVAVPWPYEGRHNVLGTRKGGGGGAR